jgi:hypothetical protein
MARVFEQGYINSGGIKAMRTQLTDQQRFCFFKRHTFSQKFLEKLKRDLAETTDLKSINKDKERIKNIEQIVKYLSTKKPVKFIDKINLVI